MPSIRLHPEHGLNPTIDTCFFCGQETGAIAFLGAHFNGEAPMHMVTSMVPCAACQKKWAQGIVIIECTERTPIREGIGAIQPGVYPTGRWAVFTDDAVKRQFDEPSAKAMLQHRKAFIEPEAFAKLMKVYADAGIKANESITT